MARTVLIVDDHAPFRAVARALLQLEGLAVVGEAADALSALEAVGRLRPDVVVLDIQLPDLDGFEVARRLAQAGDPPVGESAGVQPRQLRLPAAACKGLLWLQTSGGRVGDPAHRLAMLALEVPGTRLDRCETLSSGAVLSLLRTPDLARAG
jgi:CheY-like chemotaxis protein